MNTHPPIEHIQSITLSLYIYFGGFMGWLVVGWLEGSWGGWVGDGVGGAGAGSWRVHGVGGCVVLWVMVGCMVGWVVRELMVWVHIPTHP